VFRSEEFSLTFKTLHGNPLRSILAVNLNEKFHFSYLYKKQNDVTATSGCQILILGTLMDLWTLLQDLDIWLQHLSRLPLPSKLEV